MEKKRGITRLRAYFTAIKKKIQMLKVGRWCEKKAADARVLEGDALQLALTSESLPDTSGPGDEVFSGSTVKTAQPIETPYSEPELNQSSCLTIAETPPKLETSETCRLTNAKTLCRICMECVLTTNVFIISSCNHFFCNSCMVRYITSQLDKNIAYIHCPNPGSKCEFLDLSTCQCILPTATFDRWGLVLCEYSLGRNKFYCPFPDCSALLIAEGGEELRNCECPHCNRMFCARCKVPWHGEMTCEKFKRCRKDKRVREDLMLKKLARDKMWQICPQCSIYVDRIFGCNFMQCRCGYCFCYRCAAPISKETHYCTKCKRVF